MSEKWHTMGCLEKVRLGASRHSIKMLEPQGGHVYHLPLPQPFHVNDDQTWPDYSQLSGCFAYLLTSSNWYRAGGCQHSYNHPYPMPIRLPVRRGLIIRCYGESNPIGHEVQKVRSDVIEELGHLILTFWLVCWITTSRATKP